MFKIVFQAPDFLKIFQKDLHRLPHFQDFFREFSQSSKIFFFQDHWKLPDFLQILQDFFSDLQRFVDFQDIFKNLQSRPFHFLKLERFSQFSRIKFFFKSILMDVFRDHNRLSNVERIFFWDLQRHFQFFNVFSATSSVILNFFKRNFNVSRFLKMF